MRYYNNRLSSAIFSLVFLLFSVNAFSQELKTNQELYDLYPWSVAYFYGQTVSAPLVDVFILQWKRWPEHLQSLEVSYVFDENNFWRRFVSPLVGVAGVTLDTAVRYGADEHTIYELDPYLVFRWANLPWNQVVTTSFAIGEGVSYDTSIPAIEKRQNTNTKRLLNYLMFEATFADPNHPRWQFLLRIHHRSGAFGLYHAGNTGSNVVGGGIRYLF